MIIKNNLDEDFKREMIRLILKTIIVAILLIIAKLFGEGFEKLVTVVFGSVLVNSRI